MAPIRNVGPQRRRSSVATLAAVGSIKTSHYASSIPQSVTFAPNVTPTTFHEENLEEEEEQPVATLFPPTDVPAKPCKPRKTVNGRRRSSGHIARPPNSFMLFRSNFIRQRHVPGSIETTHGSLSKIIGNLWRGLPLEEKRVWELRAKQAKADHKLAHPDYVFRPVHTKGKKKAQKPTVSAEEEARCEEIAKLMLEGKKGDLLAQSVKQRGLDVAPSESSSPVTFDGYQSAWPPAPMAGPSNFRSHRRSSSLPPLPSPAYGQQVGPIAMPTLPSFGFYRTDSPVGTIASSSRHQLGHRRASSVQLVPSDSWLAPSFQTTFEERAESPLPEMDASLFNPSFSFGGAAGNDQPFSFEQAAFACSPTDAISPHELPAVPAPMDPLAYYPAPADTASQYAQQGGDASYPSTSYSGSPSPSDAQLPMFAPRAQHVAAPTWEQFSLAPTTSSTAPTYDGFTSCAPANVSPLETMSFGQQTYFGGAHDQFAQPSVDFQGVYAPTADGSHFQFDQFVHDV